MPLLLSFPLSLPFPKAFPTGALALLGGGLTCCPFFAAVGVHSRHALQEPVSAAGKGGGLARAPVVAMGPITGLPVEGLPESGLISALTALPISLSFAAEQAATAFSDPGLFAIGCVFGIFSLTVLELSLWATAFAQSSFFTSGSVPGP